MQTKARFTFLLILLDIESLNEALKYANLMESETNEFSSYFEKKGKTITYLRPELPEVKEDNNEEEFEEEDFDYANLFVWRFNIEFEAEVKSHNLAKDTTISIQKQVENLQKLIIFLIILKKKQNGFLK